MRTFFDRVKEAVSTANWRKGYGDIVALRLFGDGHIECDIQRPFASSITRRGHVDGNRVLFAGTSCVIPRD